MKRQLLGLAALGRNHVDIEIAIVLTGERYPLAIGREFGEQFQPRVRGNATRHASAARHQPEVAAVTEDYLVPVDVGKTHQPALGRLLAKSPNWR
jgi:hypothetical protein